MCLVILDYCSHFAVGELGFSWCQWNATPEPICPLSAQWSTPLCKVPGRRRPGTLWYLSCVERGNSGGRIRCPGPCRGRMSESMIPTCSDSDTDRISWVREQ
jgi:hypothetical protein